MRASLPRRESGHLGATLRRVRADATIARRPDTTRGRRRRGCLDLKEELYLYIFV